MNGEPNNLQLYNLIKTQDGESLQYICEDKKEYLQVSSGKKYNVDRDILCFLSDSVLTGNNRRYQRMYDRLSVFYDLITKSYARLKNGNERERLMQYLSLLNVKDGDKVIEISIGTGRNIKYLNSKADFYGVDISLGMLKKCRRNMKRLKRGIILIQAEAESLPLRDESFDVVFSAGGFNFFNDPGKAVAEMLRIAKSGTKILITDETEKVRQKYRKNDFYKANEIKNPIDYLPDYCKDIEYKEICHRDLYVLTFRKTKGAN